MPRPSDLRLLSTSESVLRVTEQNHNPPSVDAHTHIFCWGETPADGYLSEKTRKSWWTRFLLQLTGIAREPGETMSAKMRHRLFRHLRESSLDYIIVLAQDAVYRADGSRDDGSTHFYVSNNYVLELARESPAILPGCSNWMPAGRCSSRAPGPASRSGEGWPGPNRSEVTRVSNGPDPGSG